MVRRYGHYINNVPLAEVVIFLYKAARAASTRKTYAVGQRHWARFQHAHPNIPFFPFAHHAPDAVSLALCFFAAYLASRPTIRRYTTVRSYVCHVKALWRDAGCAENSLHSPLLTMLLRGVRPTPARRSSYPHAGCPATTGILLRPVAYLKSGRRSWFPRNATLWCLLPGHCLCTEHSSCK